MKRFLILSSLLLSILFAFGQETELLPFSWFDKVGKVEYSTTLKFKNNEITGISITKLQGDELIGSLVNEFGIKAFDFKYNTKSKKIKLFNVIAFMDKWYIKKALKSDLKYLFSYPKTKKSKRRNIVVREDILLLENTKYDIKYIFTPLTSIEAQKDDINE